MELALTTIRDFSPLVLGAGGISGLMLADGYRRRTTRSLRRTLKLVAAVLTSTIALATGIAIAFLLFH